MPSPFARLAAKASATADRAFGETFDYLPMLPNRDVNMRGQADPDRAVVHCFTAIYGEPFQRAGDGSAGTPGQRPERPGHSSSRPYLALQLSRLPYAPSQGDHIVRVDTGRTYRVAEIVPIDFDHVHLELNGLA